MPRSSQSRIASPAFCLVFALFCLFFSSCMVGDFVGAYFNTYYNAQKAFGEAEDDIWNQPELKMQGAGKNYLPPFNVSQNSKAKFASVIEKCSKLLQYHPESNLVDDALMMIGKSYFYQNDYQPAERKFKELITGYPKSGLVFEAKMLMAYCFYKEGDKTSASATATELLDAAKKEGDDNIIAYLSVLLGQMDLEDKNYTLALDHFRDAAASAKSREQRAFALVNVAEMYNKTGDYLKAADAYAEATRQSPNYLGEYKGQIGVARMLAKQGKMNESLELLGDLRSDMKNKEFFGEIELEIANDYRDEGNLALAVEQYRYVDTAYARTEWSANSYYQLGLLYETRVGLYDSARVAYNKGKTEAAQSLPVAPLLARRADAMNKYALFTSEIRKMDSLRTVWLNLPDSIKTSADSVVQDTVKPKAVIQDTVQRRVTEDDRERRREIAEEARPRRGTVPDNVQRKETSPADSGKTNTVQDSARVKRVTKPALSLDSVTTRLALSKSELATLFYTSIGKTDSALFWYHKLIEDHPQSSLVPRALFSIAQIRSQDSTTSKSAVDSLYRQLVEQYPETQYAAEARRLLGLPAVNASPDTAEVLYHQAEAAILAGRNENAIDTLRLIVRTYPRSSYAPRAAYAAGWLYEQVLEQPDSAIANYQRLRARYPASLYAARVQPKLMEVELRNKAIADSLARKKQAAADSLAQKNKSAIDSLAQKNKSAVDSLAQKNKALADSTAQKKPPALEQQQTKPGTEEVPRNRKADEIPVDRKPPKSPVDNDSTLAPKSGAADTTQGRRKLPPIAE